MCVSALGPLRRQAQIVAVGDGDKIRDLLKKFGPVKAVE
jgi:hypothetical protein